MNLIDAVRNLDSLDDEQTLYAAKPWTPDSEVLAAVEPESGGLPAEAEERGLSYFLEVFIAREFIESALNRDYWMALGTVVLYGTVLVILNLLVDIAYGFLDPRIRYD